jgi:hypothetical protein
MAAGQGCQPQTRRQLRGKDVGHAVAHTHDVIQPTGKARRLITPEHHGFPVGQVVTDSAPGQGRFGGDMQARHLIRQEGQAVIPLEGVAGKPVGTTAQAQQPARAHQGGGPLGRDAVGGQDLHPQGGSSRKLRQGLLE